MVKKLMIVILLVSIIGLGIREKSTLILMITQGGFPAMVMSLLLLSLCVFFPIIPFPVTAGMIGAVFGPVKGSIVTLTGSMIGTVLFFFLMRYGYRQWAQRKLKKYPKAQKYQNQLKDNAFMAIFIARLIPIIPAIAVNIGCSLCTVNWKVFFGASVIGKIPNIVFLSFAGASFQHNIRFSVFLYVLYLVSMLVMNIMWVYRKVPKTKQR
ncbi:TVP38/TMEM64 family protein [Bacillus sp. ISL-18]|uniref:TVP38/TMEM64 family protein n=1 Tax=Bacillus sp. ISL-18 TaxID=2819118 RepID=UPI001BE56D35|nr:TVP38/TMEM64 family protein [Bacillus sp. ISL-18]MBT2657942.1 TVP38/TMEM64 family protein [Bacillus sp. ISL-18]